MIETHDLSKQFDGFWAVDGINLTLATGEVLALLGPNGAGKTTTVRMLTSILRPSRGRASVNGYDVTQQADKVRASVGVLTEQHGLYDRMPANEYLDFFGQVYGLDARQRQQQSERLLHDFGLEKSRNQRIGEFSKGMRQKLALARALLHNPPILLLDEPTSAMDPESARLVRDTISWLRTSQRTIIICTHNLAEAEELADKIAIIRDGQIIAQGTIPGLKHDLLGPMEYELRMVWPLNGKRITLPDGAEEIAHGEDWLRYRTSQPERVNPVLLRDLLASGQPVLSLQQLPHSLEKVYLRAMQNNEEMKAANV
jgi:ABC-2 type transport system ATP-binding protein